MAELTLEETTNVLLIHLLLLLVLFLEQLDLVFDTLLFEIVLFLIASPSKQQGASGSHLLLLKGLVFLHLVGKVLIDGGKLVIQLVLLRLEVHFVEDLVQSLLALVLAIMLFFPGILLVVASLAKRVLLLMTIADRSTTNSSASFVL